MFLSSFWGGGLMKKILAYLLIFLFCYSFSVAKILSVDDLISLKNLGFSEEEIIKEIKKSGSHIKFTEKQKEKLKKVGFSQDFFTSLEQQEKSNVNDIIRLIEQNTSITDVLEYIYIKRKDIIGRKDIIDKLQKKSVPYPVIIAVKGEPISTSQLLKISKFSLDKKGYEILISITGAKKENISPEYALKLIKAGVPATIVKFFKEEHKSNTQTISQPSALTPPPLPQKTNILIESHLLKDGRYAHIGKKFTIKCPKNWRILRELDEDGSISYAFTPQMNGNSIKDLETAFLIFLFPVSRIIKDIYWINDPVNIYKKMIEPVILKEEKDIKILGSIKRMNISGMPAARIGYEGKFHDKQGRFKGNIYVLLNKKLIFGIQTYSLEGEYDKYKKDFEYILENSTFGSKKKSSRGKTLDASDLIKKYKKSVVVVTATTGFRKGSQGTGFIVSKDGYILTNWHVIWDFESHKPFEEFSVSWDDSLKLPPKKAKLIGYFHKTSGQVRTGGIDVALLKIDPGSYTPIPLTPLKDVELGDEIITLGFPYSSFFSGYSIFVTKGVVVRFNRDLNGNIESLAIDAKITHGNSGGPCLDLKTGGAIGLNTWAYGIQVGVEDQKQYDLAGYNFVCPSDSAARQFPLVLLLGIGDKSKLSFLDFYELSSFYYAAMAPYAAFTLADDALKINENKYSLTQKANSLFLLAATMLADEPAETVKKIQEAEALFKKALNLDPQYQEALTGIIELYFETDRANEAKKYALQYVKFYPEDWDGYLQLAKIYLSSNEKQKAKEELQKALRLSKNLVEDPYIFAGELAYDEKRLEEGKNLFDTASKINPNNLEARIGQIKYFELKNEWEKALEHYRDLQSKFPRNPVIFYRIARCLRQLKKIDDSLKFYGKALSSFKKRGFFPPGELFLDIADIFENIKKELDISIRFLAKYLLYYGDEKGAIKVHAKLASIINNQGVASAHVRSAIKLSRQLNTKFEVHNFQYTDLSLNDIKYMLARDYPPLVVAKLILNTTLSFKINSTEDVKKLIKVQHLPLPVVRAIIEKSKRANTEKPPATQPTATPPPLPNPNQPPEIPPLPPQPGTTPPVPGTPQPPPTAPVPPPTLPSLPTPPSGQLHPTWLVGVWVGAFNVPGIGTFYEKDIINADGTIISQTSTPYGPYISQGTWHVEGNYIVIQTNTGISAKRTFRRIGPGKIALYNDQLGIWINFTKEQNMPNSQFPGYQY